MFENLSIRLEKAIKTLKGQGKITEINVAETVKEIRRALLDADVSFKIAKTSGITFSRWVDLTVQRCNTAALCCVTATSSAALISG